MIHAVVPSLGERNELRIMIKSLVAAELTGVAVKHYLVTWTVLKSLAIFHALSVTRKYVQLRQIVRVDGRYGVQGHSRSFMFVPIESPYATSY